MAQHSVKIEDKLYEKLKAYCGVNKISVSQLCNEAIAEYLNSIEYGDAPFLVENRQNSQETQTEIDKITNELSENAKDLKKIDVLPTKDADEKITELLAEEEIVKENTEQTKEKEVKRPTKRRL